MLGLQHQCDSREDEMTKLNIKYDEAQHEPRIVNSEVQSEES